MLDTIYYHIRNNHPIFYFITLIFAFIVLLIETVSFTANNTAFFDMLGATRFKTKVIAAKETAYWHYRTWLHNNTATAQQPVRAYGFLQSVNRDGTVNITLIKNGKYQVQRITLADATIKNPEALAGIVEMNKQEDAEFDFYSTRLQYPYTVVWINENPFNLQLIISGIANPDTTPPTNIVDRLFAEYYWAQLTN